MGDNEQYIGFQPVVRLGSGACIFLLSKHLKRKRKRKHQNAPNLHSFSRK
jgi:hypothetical protein